MAKGQRAIQTQMAQGFSDFQVYYLVIIGFRGLGFRGFGLRGLGVYGG